MELLNWSLLIIFIAITIIPGIAKRIGIPVIVGEIVFGIIVGKSALDIVPENSLFDFFSSFGLVFLMFLAGLEIDLDKIKRSLLRTIVIAAFSISVPFLAGYYLAPYAGVNPYLLGTIFSTTSLGIILPLVRELKGRPTLRSVLLGSVVLVDIISMFILAFSLTIIEGPITSSFYYSLALIIVLFFLPVIFSKVSRIRKKIDDWLSSESLFEKEVRITFALILILGAVSEQLGFHAIIGAFIAGLIISETTTTAPMLQKKLEGIGYGFFVPLFFIIVGAKVDLPGIFSNLTNVTLLLVIIVSAIGAKVIGVAVVSRISGFNTCQSLAMGLFHAARLSLIIAAVEIVSDMGLIDANLYSTFILMAVVSAVAGPAVGKAILSRDKILCPPEEDEADELLYMDFPYDGPV